MSEKKSKQSKSKAKAASKSLVALVAKAKTLCTPSPIRVATDEKGRTVVEKPLQSSKGMLSSAMGKTPFRTKIFYVSSADNGSSGAAYSTVINANMATAGEWATFAALFDEVRCHRVTVGVHASIGAWSAHVMGIVAFDENDNTALASIQAGMSATYRAGPHVLTNKAAGITWPAGYQSMELVTVKSPKLERSVFPAESSGTPLAYPTRGDWVPTSASTAIVCFFKPYLEAIASNTWAVRHVLEWEVEYRLRS
jgi:hypothetical protein